MDESSKSSRIVAYDARKGGFIMVFIRNFLRTQNVNVKASMNLFKLYLLLSQNCNFVTWGPFLNTLSHMFVCSY